MWADPAVDNLRDALADVAKVHAALTPPEGTTLVGAFVTSATFTRGEVVVPRFSDGTTGRVLYRVDGMLTAKRPPIEPPVFKALSMDNYRWSFLLWGAAADVPMTVAQ